MIDKNKLDFLGADSFAISRKIYDVCADLRRLCVDIGQIWADGWEVTDKKIFEAKKDLLASQIRMERLLKVFDVISLSLADEVKILSGHLTNYKNLL